MNLSYLREFALGGYKVTRPSDTSYWQYIKVCATGSTKLARALRDIEKEKNPTKKKRAYWAALKTANECKRLAQQIPDDTAGDVIFNYCVKPWYWFLLKYAGQAIKTGEYNPLDNMKSINRDAAVSNYDKVIRILTKEMNSA